jgi:hypothetical protein
MQIEPPSLHLANRVVPSLLGWRKTTLERMEGDWLEQQTKLQTVVFSAPHALRGLTNGVINIQGDALKKPCFVIGEGFASWLFHVSELGYRVDQVIIKKPIHSVCIHKICGADVLVWSGSNLSTLMATFSAHGGVGICFVDGRITPGLLSALAELGVYDMISTQTPQSSCQGWQLVFSSVPHSKVGGATTKIVMAVPHSRQSLSGLPVPWSVTAKRDASTVLCHSTFGCYFRPRPADTIVDPLQCSILRSDQHPYYHSYGWLPTGLDCNLCVITPVLNAPAQAWGLRTIACEEILLCNNVQSTAVSLIMSARPHHSFYSLVLPGKCLLAGFLSLLNGRGGMGMFPIMFLMVLRKEGGVYA